jgi:hypothetical protein
MNPQEGWKWLPLALKARYLSPVVSCTGGLFAIDLSGSQGLLFSTQITLASDQPD